MKLTPVFRLVIASGLAFSLSAQTTTSNDAGNGPMVEMEAFTVTGSNIRRVDAESALPVSVLTREAIADRGGATMAELLETINIAEISAINEVNNGPQQARGDVASIDLRGLGSGSTLVLVNGRRMAPHPISMAENGVPSLSANINTVPRGMIDRLEILRDGASAVYGADAAAGVVNSIISGDFKNRTLRLRGSVTEDGGAEEVGLQYTDGFEWRGTRVSYSLDLFHREPLWTRERDYSREKDQRLGRTPPAPWDGVPLVDANGTTVRDNDFSNSNAGNPTGRWQRGFIQPDFLTFKGSRPAGNNGITTSTTPPVGVATTASNGTFYLWPDADGSLRFKQTAPSRNIDADEYRFYSNWNQYSTILPETDRIQLGVFFNRNLTDKVELFGDLMFYNAESLHNRQPTNFKNTDDVGIYVPASNPWNPFGVNFYHPTGAANADGSPRLVGTPADITTASGLMHPDFAPRNTEIKSYSARLLTGLKGNFSNGWSWESALLLSTAQTHEWEHFQVRESVLRRALARTDLTAFNPFSTTFKIENGLIKIDQPYSNPAAVIDALYIDEERFGRTELFSWDARIVGEISMPVTGWNVGLAAGVETRYESYQDKRPPFVGQNPAGSGADFPFLRDNDNDILALSPNVPIDANQNVAAAYVEAVLPLFGEKNHLPLIQALELSAAGRFEHYSIHGSTAKPKATLFWKPFDWMKFRAAASESFRPPNLVQTNTSPLRRQVVATDSYRFDVTAAPDDGSLGRLTFRQGNVELTPEESSSRTGGVVVDVPFVKGLSLTFDYFDIKQSDVIENFGTAAALAQDALLLDLATQAGLAQGQSIDQIDLGSGTANYLGYSSITRIAVTAADRSAFAAYNAQQTSNAAKRAPVGSFDNAVDNYINLSSRNIQGYEFGVQWVSPRWEIGRFSFKGEATHYLKRSSQQDIDSLEQDELLRNGRADWRASASLGWKRGSWSAGWFSTYFGGSVDTSAATTEAVYLALAQPDYIRAFNDNGITRYLLWMEPLIIHNAFLSYKFEGNEEQSWFNGTTVRVGVNNLTNLQPPFADENFGYRPGIYNPRGRQFTFELSRTF